MDCNALLHEWNKQFEAKAEEVFSGNIRSRFSLGLGFQNSAIIRLLFSSCEQQSVLLSNLTFHCGAKTVSDRAFFIYTHVYP